jgi:phosphoglycolate phosphatase
MGVVSNKPVFFCRKILEGLDVADRFGTILGGDSAPERKPHPEPIYMALKLLGASPAEAIIVGDSAVDVEAGRKAGLRTCGVTYGLAPPEEVRRARPDHVIDHFADLLEVLRGEKEGPRPGEA